MADLYDEVSITGYNANPPDDDGSQTEANRITWAKPKEKLGDPLKNAIDAMNGNVKTFSEKIDGGVTSYGSSTLEQESDQGKLVRATVAGITITTPDATAVGAPFVFAFLNDSTGDVTIDGHDTQTVDGLTAFTVPAGAGFRMRTNGSNWFTEGRNFQRTQVKPQGYLTLLSLATSPLSPMPTSDQSAKTTVYYRPDGGNLLPISDATNITVREFSELSLALVSNHVANGIYDVFAFDDSGTTRIGTGPVWNTVTAGSGARGTGAGTTELDLLDGLLVNKNAATLRNGSSTYSVAAKAGVYLGSIYIDGSAGQVSCHIAYGQSRKWGVWNAFNRRQVTLKAGDATASWTYATATTRAANNASANSITLFAGFAEDSFDIDYSVNVAAGLGVSASMFPFNYVGYNSTTAGSGKSGSFGAVADNNNGITLTFRSNLVARYIAPPSLGINVATALENGGGGSSGTFSGTEANMVLTARWAA